MILQPTKQRARGREFMSIRLEVAKQFSVDFDVRKLLDRLRVELGRALVANAPHHLAREYSLGPITGTAARAKATILNRSDTASPYFDRVFEGVAHPIIERETQAWLLQAMPPSGDGVGTPPSANTSGGALR